MKTSLLLVLFLPLVYCQTSVYNLNIEVDTKSLAQINAAQQSIVLVSGGLGNGWYTVCSVFRPYAFNYITWNTSYYYIYASTTPLVNGNTILRSYSMARALSGLFYPFVLGTFASGRTVSWVGKNEIGTNNSDSSSYTFGIAQDINVNSKWLWNTPISAEMLLAQEHASFPSPTTFFLFLAQNTLPSGILANNLDEISNSKVATIPLSMSNKFTATWNPTFGVFDVMYS